MTAGGRPAAAGPLPRKAAPASAQRVPSAASGALHRYLRYDALRVYPAGMHNQLRNLEWLMREAFMLGRRAVLPTLHLAPAHNRGHADGTGPWDKYFDLDASRLVDAGGRRHPLPLVRRLPAEPLDTVVLEPGARVSPAARAAELVVRQVKDPVHLRNLPYEPWRRLLGDVLAGPNRIAFDMRPSALVRRLSAPVVAALYAEHDAYAAAHIRRGDGLRQRDAVRRRTGPAHVARRLARLGLGPDDAVFFLSDEPSAAYWRPLESGFRVVRHTDFPQLAAALAGHAGTASDNYLLYEVEKEIMRGAAVRLETIPGPNYTPAHGAMFSRLEWTLVNIACRAREGARRWRRRLAGG